LRQPAAPSLTPHPADWPENGITVCWLGHATTLLRFYGVNVLMDPVFSARVGVDIGLGTAGPKRLIAPALTPGQLPDIDVVVLSHAHMDHLDLPSLGSLPGRPQVVTARDTSDLLAGLNLGACRELGWGDGATLSVGHGELRIEAFEVRHWGRRWPSNRDRGYNGYILRREGRAVLFAGDTAFTELFAPLRRRGPFELGLMPIGAYNPWIRSHCTPEQALEMAEAAGVRRLVPVHHSTFKLSDEPAGEPLERFERALEREAGRIALRRVGETCRVA
jgi:L-ascorbate metabolism protein UlaG (beta-lactamase superfamily)